MWLRNKELRFALGGQECTREQKSEAQSGVERVERRRSRLMIAHSWVTVKYRCRNISGALWKRRGRSERERTGWGSPPCQRHWKQLVQVFEGIRRRADVRSRPSYR